MYKMRSSGFTLVEIAIVMVIIGLLLGGALKGQQMIESARYKALKTEIVQIQAAIYSFSDIYGYLPGDIPESKLTLLLPDATASSGADGGTAGDGKITGGYCNSGNEEPCMVFHHLRQADLLNGDRTVAGIATPFETPAGGLFDSVSSGWEAGDNSLKLIMRNVPGDAAQRLDTELDDGNGKTGSIRCPSCNWTHHELLDIHMNL